jgi:hypothetical protein
MSFSILALHKSFASNVHEQLFLSSFRPLDAPPPPPFFSTQVATPFGPEKPASQPASLPARNERELVLELEVFLGV